MPRSLAFLLRSLSLLTACGGLPPKPAGEPSPALAYRAALVAASDPAVEITLALTGADAGETTLATAPGWDIDAPEKRFLGLTIRDGRGQVLPVIAEPGHAGGYATRPVNRCRSATGSATPADRTPPSRP